MSSFKHLLTLIGPWCSKRRLRHLQALVDYMKLGHWMHEHEFTFSQRVLCREDMWDVVVGQVWNQRVLYLEFGVWRGQSMRYWSRRLKHPDAVLHGFDSFEGLPEEGGPWIEGEFSTGGSVPRMDDPRVSFFKGWFDQVLPTYSIPPHDILVINMDADLYSSTIYVLRHLRPHIKAGTYIYFDEMSHMEHEPRAFSEFMKESKLAFRPVSGDKSLDCVFFQCIG